MSDQRIMPCEQHLRKSERGRAHGEVETLAADHRCDTGETAVELRMLALIREYSRTTNQSEGVSMKKLTAKQQIVMNKVRQLGITHIDENNQGVAKFPDGQTINGNLMYALTERGIFSTIFVPGTRGPNSQRRRHVLTTADTPKRNFKITCKAMPFDNTEEHTVLIDAYNSTQALHEALDLVPYRSYHGHRVTEVL